MFKTGDIVVATDDCPSQFTKGHRYTVARYSASPVDPMWDKIEVVADDAGKAGNGWLASKFILFTLATAPVFQIGDIVYSKYDYPQVSAKIGEPMRLLKPDPLPIWQAVVIANGLEFRVHEQNFTLAAPSVVGEFEQQPEEVRKSRADAIWEALQGVAKPN